MDKKPVPRTLLEAVTYFADPQVAHDFFVALRWPNGAGCPRCGNALVSYMPKYRRWHCNDCRRQFTAKTGTIFEESPISFSKWLPAIWLLTATRNGTSSCELARALGVTQKTAWFMLHRIREAMADDSPEPLTGIVEADEAYIGGKWENKPLKVRKALGRRAYQRDGKTTVFGLVQRNGKARAWSVPNATKKTLLPKMLSSIDRDATIYTDEAWFYKHINEYFLLHASVNHSILEYVRGDVHTNNIEAFWAVLKRTIGGTYTHVSPRHLDRYLAEQVYRFNEREEQDGPRFVGATKMTEGKRLTYKALTNKEARR